MTSIREIYTAAAERFNIDVITDQHLEAVTGWSELRGPGNTRPTLDRQLSAEDVVIVATHAVEWAGRRAGLDDGARGRMSRAEAREAGTSERTIWDEEVHAAYTAALQDAITAIS